MIRKAVIAAVVLVALAVGGFLLAVWAWASPPNGGTLTLNPGISIAIKCRAADLTWKQAGSASGTMVCGAGAVVVGVNR